jgi:hypothetical protein
MRHKTPHTAHPTEFDYKFAEMTIDAYQAIYERTGEFMPETQLKRIAREIKKMREDNEAR